MDDGSKYKILIVDDIPDNIKVISNVLKQNNNYIIKGVTDGKTALKTIKTIMPDIILLDIKMPEMDGFEVCKLLKEDPNTQDIPVIFITALSETESKVKGFGLGGVDYITKPFQAEEVLIRVQTQLKISNYTKLLKEYNISLEEKIQEEQAEKIRAMAWFDAAFEQSEFGVAFTNRDQKIFLANKYLTNFLGYDNSTELKGHIINNLYEDHKELYDQLINDKISYISFEKEFTKKDGSNIWIKVYSAKVTLPGSSDFSFITIYDDITEKHFLKKELSLKEDILINQSKHASMGELIGMIAHQWKQPISVISMAANNIKLDIDLNSLKTDDVQKGMDEILAMVEHLSDTINDFKDYFKPEKAPENTTISHVIEKALSIIGKSLENHSIEVKIDNNATSEIKVFVNELVQVFINIINNSKDAIVKQDISNGKITITVNEDENGINITLEDNGKGIPEDIIKEVGKRYFSTKGEQGTGLGIYMSKLIVNDKIGGDLSWYNQNEGACFSIKLPKTN